MWMFRSPMEANNKCVSRPTSSCFMRDSVAPQWDSLKGDFQEMNKSAGLKKMNVW